MAQLASPGDSSDGYYVVTTIDPRGRLADRSPLRFLRWQAGTPIRISAAVGTSVVHSDAGGQERITPQGHLRLRPTVRRVCRIGADDRLLVAAYPGRQLLIVLTMPVLDAMLRADPQRLLSEALQ
jgi:hypothetical protein